MREDKGQGHQARIERVARVIHAACVSRNGYTVAQAEMMWDRQQERTRDKWLRVARLALEEAAGIVDGAGEAAAAAILRGLSDGGRRPVAAKSSAAQKDGPWPGWKRIDLGDSGDLYELVGPDGEGIHHSAWGHNIYDPPGRRRRSSRPFAAELPEREKDPNAPGLLRNRAGAVRTFPTAEAARQAIETARKDARS